MNKQFKRVVAVLLCLVMTFCLLPTTALASIEGWEENNVIYDGTTFGTNGYYNVISQKDYTLVPGAAYETEMVLNNSTNNRRQVLHIVEVDPSNPDISVIPGYYGIDRDLTDVNNQVAALLTDTAKYYEDNLGYNVVAGMNTALRYDSNYPTILVYNGQNLTMGRQNTQTYLGVYKDAEGNISCMVKAASEFDADFASGTLWQAMAVNFGFVVKDGALVSATEERTSSTAARSLIGIKEDGTLVFVMNDGRGANNSVGFNNYELGESMLALGCKWAVNCDGGGSSTFISKRAGESTWEMRSVPCDGAQRPTIHSMFIVSNVGPTGVLHNVEIESNYDYFAPGTTFTFDAKAVDTHGYEMALPEGATWALSDTAFGTISNGTFVSNGTLGDVDIQVLSGETVVGSRTIHVANPTTLKLSVTETVLPYSTPDKPRETEIPVEAKIGEADVYYDSGSFTVALDDPTAATLDGFTIRATEDTSKTGVVATVTYIPTNTVLTYTVTYGKGSEILWDFEDNIDGWLGQQAAHDWQVAHGVTPFDEDKSVNNSLNTSGQMNASSRSRTFLSTRENGGQVHNGHSALGVEYDFTGADFNSWVYMILFNVQNVPNADGTFPIVLRDTANGKNATGVGMWLYLPVGFHDDKNNGSLALQMNLYFRTADGKEGQTGVNMQYKGKNLNALTEADIPDGRWIYVKGALPNYPYVALTNPMQSNFRAPSIFRMYIKPSIAQTLTYYYDDITLDYSDAVDDRDEPVISNPCYAINDTAISLDGTPTVASASVTFTADAADVVASNATGLNTATAQVYLDGVACETSFVHGKIIANAVRIASGEHTVVFEIYDNIGNIGQCKRTFNCSDESNNAFYLAGHNDSGLPAETGSIYYLDLKAKEIEKVNTVVTTIDLQTANTWQLEHMTVANGFTATYTVNEAEPEFATLTITKTGNVTLTGDQTLVSIPVRVWFWHEDWLFGGDGTAAQSGTAARYNKYGEPVLKIEADFVYGLMNNDVPFGGSFSVATKVDGNKTSGLWHIHDAELTALPDQAATCTQPGYTGRTYCETCKSIVDWGTTIPATGHDWQLVNGEFICNICGEALNPGTGLFECNGKYYYAVNNVLQSGWVQIENDFYYFDPQTFAPVETYNTGKVTYTFDETGKLAHGEWYNDGIGWKYYYGPDYYHHNGTQTANCVWAEIDGETYAFNENGYRYEGLSLVYNNVSMQIGVFSDEGVYQGDYKNGKEGAGPEILDCCFGVKVYVVDGYPEHAGLFKLNGFWHYARGKGIMVVDGSYNCTLNMTRSIPAGDYNFDADGNMILPQGITYVDGNLYYYGEDGREEKGLVRDERGLYYYFGHNLYALGEGDYYFPEDKLNGYTYSDGVTPLTAGTYHVNADRNVVIPDLKNGIYEEGGKLYYYENSIKVQKGLVKDDNGDFYYFGLKYYAVSDGTFYFPEEKLNGLTHPGSDVLLHAGNYVVGADGKVVIPEVKNGIYDEDGKKWYYENDERVAKGLVQDASGDFYYFGLKYYALSAGTYYFPEEKLNGLTDPNGDALQAGNYEVGADGKVIIKVGVYRETDNTLHYYVGGKYLKDTGLMIIGKADEDPYYIFIQKDGSLVANQDYPLRTLNDFIRWMGDYKFDENGRLIPTRGEVVGIRNGRDIGYLTTESGAAINDGLFIRGAGIDSTVLLGDGSASSNTMTAEQTAFAATYLNTHYGITTEMDLRDYYEGDRTDPLGPTVNHKYYTMQAMYNWIFTDNGKEKVKTIFTDLAKPETYPVYLHCSRGVDRTGMITCLLLGTLGVSEHNISIEYCRSIGGYEPNILIVRNYINENYEGDTYQERTEAYLLDCGVTQEQIESIQNIFLGAPQN